MNEFNDHQAYARAFGNKFDSDEYPPSRAWDQIELNLHHDYLDAKKFIMTCEASHEHEGWQQVDYISKMAISARRARLNGEDPLHWRLRYDGKDAPDEVPF